MCTGWLKVVWSTGHGENGLVRKVYTVETPVKAALWCHINEQHCFDDSTASSSSGPAKQTLCIVEDVSITLFAATGAVFTIPTPFTVVQVYALDRGLLIVAAPAPDTAPNSESGPNLYTLSHPLEDFRPLGLSYSQEPTPATLQYMHDTWSLLQIVSEHDPPLGIFYDPMAARHVVCSIEATPIPVAVADTTEETPEPGRRCRQIWVGAPSSRAHKAFLCRTSSSQSLVCFVDASTATLTCLRLDATATGLQCSDAFAIPALDAVAVCSLCPVTPFESSLPEELLVLEPDGTFGLFSGQDRLLSVELPLPPGATPFGLQDVVSNRCTVQTTNGDYYRVAINLRAHSPAVQTCVAGIQCLVPPRQQDSGSTTAARAGAVSCPTANTMLTLLRRAYLPQWAADMPEWDAFMEACATLVAQTEGAGSSTATAAPSLSDWEQLLASDVHSQSLTMHTFSCFDEPGVRTPLQTAAPSASSRVAGANAASSGEFGPVLFCALHLAYENSKVDMRLSTVSYELVQLLCQLAAALGWRTYLDYYRGDWPNLQLCAPPTAADVCSPSANVACTLWDEVASTPPCLYSWLLTALHGANDQPPFPTLATHSRDFLMDILIDIYRKFRGGDDGSVTVARDIVSQFVQAGYGRHELDCLPMDIGLPIREAIRLCRTDPPGQWPVPAYMLIGREDLAAQTRGDGATDELSQSSWQQVSNNQQPQPTGTSDDDDGTYIASELTSLRFGSDLRLGEVRRILSSSKSPRVRVTQTPEMGDHDYANEQKAQLQLLIQRTMAAPVGRGMLTLHTMRPIITQALKVPELNLKGRGLNKGTVVLDDAATARNVVAWPQFHNGVAAGLRVAKAGHTKLSTNWIAFHRPSNNELTDEHAGFLMAIGLSGHLKALSNMTIFDFLTKGHETTSAGLLLGMAAAQRGSMDPAVAKMLGIHVPALLPSTSAELEVPQMVQTAALVGVGLLYQGTAHRRIAEVLLTELGRRPGPGADATMDREAYSLSAGFALGMVTLGKGDDAPGLTDLRMTERLRRYMEGGRDPRKNFDVCHHVKEGDMINTDVTSPGATLAIGFMFLKRHNQAVAALLEVPDTQFLLDFIRPDFLLLRVLSHSLIMWDNIRPTTEWVESKCPGVVSEYRLGSEVPEDTGSFGQVDRETLRQAYVNITAGACFAIGLRYAGSANEDAFNCLMHYAKLFLKGGAEIPRATLETSLNLVVLCIGMVFAGTGDLNALRFFRQLNARVGPEVSYGSHMTVHMALGFLFLGGGTLSLGTSNEDVVALVAACFPRFPITSADNRYHLQALRHLYVLAVSPCVVVARDVDTGEPCYVPMTLNLPQSQKQLKLITPCIIPDLNLVSNLTVRGPRYADQKYNPAPLPPHLSTTSRNVVRSSEGR